jgi:ribonuclease D
MHGLSFMQNFYVETPEQLEELCDRLRGSAALALDTEFMREKTYYAQLCLFQIANDRLIACVDPLAIPDLSPLLDIIYDRNILKVMHAGRQDLEILYDIRGTLPKPVFDTQIGATLLGYGDQVSYGALVRDMLGVELEKIYTRTNWAQRPLDSGQILYAEDDVRYLLEISQRQMRLLDDKGRSDWLTEDFNDMADEKNYAKLPDEAWQRIRGIRVLKDIQLSVLRALAAWREDRARTIDKPRKWIIRDDVLVDLARQMPTDMDALRDMRGLDPQTFKRAGADIVDVIQEAKMLPKEQWPKLGFRFSPSAEQEALVDAMMAIVRQYGLENSISPAAMSTRRDLEQLLTGRDDLPILHGWRGRMIGRDLRAFLNGELTLSVEQGRLKATK